MLLLLLAVAAQAAPSPASPLCSANDPSVCGHSIYFDSGEGSAIRADWNSVLDAAAASVRGGGTVRIDGFSDRSGPPAANVRVARQRAQAVRQALLQRGVGPAAISVVAHGEADALVPTPDGVREPQNRRVDLTVVP